MSLSASRWVQLSFEDLLEEEQEARLRLVAEDYRQAIDPAGRLSAALDRVRARMSERQPAVRRRTA